MNSLNSFLSSPLVKEYFGNLEEEEIKRRLMLFLEIYPFLFLLFESREESESEYSHEVFKSQKANLTRILEELREEARTIEIDV